MPWRAFLVIFLLALAGCSDSSRPGAPSCPTPVTGAKWVPDISGADPANHDPSVSVTRAVRSVSGPVLGLADPAPASQEISVPIDMSEDLGAHGSLSLVARVMALPSELQGAAYPLLVSLVDSSGNDYVNLPRAGNGGDCAAQGYYICSGTNCSPNPACAPVSPSAYVSREQWEQHQILNAGAANFPSVNVFPTCNWADGLTATGLYPACAFNQNGFFQPGTSRLRTGTYRAKYLLLANSYKNLAGYGLQGALEVDIIKKSSAAPAPTGAIDLNVLIVGTTNVNASHTAKGQQNLNTLFSTVAAYYAAGTAPIKLGRVNAIDWPCESGGDAYANLGTARLGELFANANSLLDPSSEGKALNIFLVSTIENDINSLNPNAIIDGFSSSIGGPMINGTAASGLAFATFEKLDQFNAGCSNGPRCDVTVQDSEFYNMETTIAHEMGHYLGLNHPSESDGQRHDSIPDTPLCTALPSGVCPSLATGTPFLTTCSCLNNDTNVYPATSQTCHSACGSYNSVLGIFCPAAAECPFNHVMWYTTKNFKEGAGTGDGNLFSADSREILGFSSFVR